MDNSSTLSGRKNDHIEINLNRNVNSSNTTGLEKFHLLHSALPELDFQDVDPSSELFGKTLAIPLQISSMTGGTDTAKRYNQIFASIAEKHRIAFGVGSQRVQVDSGNDHEWKSLRKIAPTTLVFSNLGAVQLNYGFTAADCRKAIESIEADALILHLNSLQEVIMKAGDTNFSDLLQKIEKIAKQISVPLIVKEVGWGINGVLARQLFEAGATAVDVAGAGGTSWSEVEMHRTDDPILRSVASQFTAWGIPTADALLDVRAQNPDKLVFASGGLAGGVDIVKCLALGADLCGIARPFLKLAEKSADVLDAHIQVLKKTITTAMFAVGAKNISDLDQGKITSK